jgi:hypothetical protein
MAEKSVAPKRTKGETIPLRDVTIAWRRPKHFIGDPEEGVFLTITGRQLAAVRVMERLAVARVEEDPSATADADPALGGDAGALRRARREEQEEELMVGPRIGRLLDLVPARDPADQVPIDLAVFVMMRSTLALIRSTVAALLSCSRSASTLSTVGTTGDGGPEAAVQLCAEVGPAQARDAHQRRLLAPAPGRSSTTLPVCFVGGFLGRGIGIFQ